LLVYEDLAAAATASRDLALDIVLWSAFLTDRLEVCLNGQALECRGGDPEWKDGQIYSDRPQPSSGARSAYTPDPNQRLLRLTYAARPEQCRVGLNEVAVRVLSRGPHKCGGRGTLIEVEKVELAVRWTRPA
jgi:hypothetical protein